MNERDPDFDELVDPDLEPLERERLLRVHELLVAAGPPPELHGQLEPPPAAPTTAQSVPRRRWIGALRARDVPRRRWAGALALAAAVGVAAFGIGFLAGNNGNGGAGSSRVIAMSGTSASPGSSASLILYNDDAAGNWPMKLSIQGLAPAPADRPYELWLTKNGRLAALCGSFLVESSGTTVVPMNAPYELKEYTGWVVVVEGSRKPLLTTA